ncbi:MAG TPA: DOMON-like domain-containing protein [Burkholderiales bacterium]
MIALECHPESRGGAVRRVVVEVDRRDGALFLAYRIEGKTERLLVPPPGLRPIWQHTCCEAFVARPGSPAYHELNFSPSGDWAAHAFTDYRRGAPFTAPDPRIVFQALPGRMELRASVGAAPGPLLLGLSAVIEERDGTLSYWALRHAPGKPDFHHRHAFALELA